MLCWETLSTIVGHVLSRMIPARSEGDRIFICGPQSFVVLGEQSRLVDERKPTDKEIEYLRLEMWTAFSEG